jgi:hypothetical protein
MGLFSSPEIAPDPTWPWPVTPPPYWSVQKCPVCDGKGYVPNGLTLSGDKCSLCDGKKAVLVNALGAVRKIREVE